MENVGVEWTLGTTAMDLLKAAGKALAGIIGLTSFIG